MLKINELIKSIKLARSKEECPCRHFDHNANCFSGPFSGDFSPLSQKNSNSDDQKVKGKSFEDFSTNVNYEAFEEVDTGEILYRALNVT